MKLLILLALVGTVLGCDTWPNGTDTTFNWWVSCGTKVIYYDAYPTDSNNNPEYPIHLGQPVLAHANITNLGNVYKNLKITLKIYSWGGWSGCDWHELPTFGLLDNLDACQNGVPCPVPTGNQILVITLDFSKFQAIINLLTDDAPYQIWFQLSDVDSGDQTCLTVQARARIH
ncbi:hypothetical protein FO519_005379 [Halicephalobus sp. NKZ332]|nr:hypothetical protein FO519_005379 [Halicephalobus sp. NKZ332]